MRPSSVAAFPIIKLTSPGGVDTPFASKEMNDLVAVEEPLEIRIEYGPENNRQQKNISVTMRTPGNDTELTTGFLFTEGIISGYADIMGSKSAGHLNKNITDSNILTVELQPGFSFDAKKLDRHFYTSSSCGVCGKSSIDSVKNIINKKTGQDTIRIHSHSLMILPELLLKQQEVFEHTGGLHASALFDLNGSLLFVREDVGRHNALDKLVGAALIAGNLPLDHHILLLSGRASFELIQKAAMAGIKIVCAVGAPSSLAVEMAKECDMTLIGFLRGGRFNIYSGEQRIAK